MGQHWDNIGTTLGRYAGQEGKTIIHWDNKLYTGQEGKKIIYWDNWDRDNKLYTENKKVRKSEFKK